MKARRRNPSIVLIPSDISKYVIILAIMNFNFITLRSRITLMNLVNLIIFNAFALFYM